MTSDKNINWITPAQATLITPSLAMELLKLNTSNRRVRERDVRRYSKDMESGHWPLTPATIAFGKSGPLLDGQHRLLACVRTGKSFWSFLVKDLEDEDLVFSVLDRQAKRGSIDILGHAGIPDPRNVGAAANFALLIQEKRVLTRENYEPREILEFLEANPEIKASAALAHGCRAYMYPSVLAGLHFHFAKIDESAANLLVHQLVTGENLSITDPVFTLRKTLIEAALPSRSTRRGRLTKQFQAAFLVKTWNAERSGRPMRICKWSLTEGFPEISK